MVGVLSGCDKKVETPDAPKDETVFSPNYIQSYLVAKDIEKYFMRGTISFKGDEIDNQSPGEKAQYDELSEKYNDKTYNDYLPPLQNCAVVGLQSMSITCTPAFDEQHIDGGSIDDIVLLSFYSFYDYIQDGYKVFGPSTRHPGPEIIGKDGYRYKEKLLSECIPDDFRLIGPSLQWYFTVPVPVGVKFTFTITVQFENDQEIQQHGTVMFTDSAGSLVVV